MLRLIQSLFFFFVLGTPIIFGVVFYSLHHISIDLFQHKYAALNKPSIVYDIKQHEWARFALDRKKPVQYVDIPPIVIQAFISAEDHAFFDHIGISIKGIIRSLLVNLYHRKKVQGASTITQQLVRLLFFDSKKTFTRKLKEQCVALLVEQKYSKEQILQAYLNNIYFGCGIYGIQAASHRFWGKSIQDITLDEAATLAAIVKSPARYCPLLSQTSAKKRRNVVLSCMKKCGYIDDTQYNKACACEINVINQDSISIAPHLKETIRSFLEAVVGKKRLYTDGLHIQTTLDMRLQKMAQTCFSDHLQELKKSVNKNIDGALLSMDVKTGQIRALIGGYDFKTSMFNRATQARRQIGSIFKPVLYAAAIERGMHLGQTEVDEPILLEYDSSVWRPQNDSRTFHGKMTLAWALSQSNNVIAAKLIAKIGCKTVARLAEKCRLGYSLAAYPSLALGCLDASLKQVIGMFNVFANHGRYVEPHMLLWIKDEWGKKIWQYQPKVEQVISPLVSGQVSKVLELSMERAKKTRKKESWIDADAIGKTGTTNDSRTCWFAGATPELITGIYIGCDNNQSIGRNVYASRVAFPIWLQLHKAVQASIQSFEYDSRLQERLVHRTTGRHIVKRDPTYAIPIFIVKD